jgi:hypothetical protein
LKDNDKTKFIYGTCLQNLSIGGFESHPRLLRFGRQRLERSILAEIDAKKSVFFIIRAQLIIYSGDLGKRLPKIEPQPSKVE